MKFKDEYKKELNNISPTEEQCERIRSGVAKKIAETAHVKRKKPLYLRIAAVSGASICAAAVLIVVIFGTGGGKRIATGFLTNKGNDTAGSYTDAGGIDDDLPPKSEDNLQHSYGGASTSTASPQSDLSTAGTLQSTSSSNEGASSEISCPPGNGDGTDSSIVNSGEPMTGGEDELPPGEPDPTGGGGDEPPPGEPDPTGGGGDEPIPGEPASTGGGGNEPIFGGGGGDEPGIGGGGEIPEGFVYLAFSEDNSVCEVTVNNAARSYRLDEDASAPPLFDDTAFGAVTNNGLDVLAQFDKDMMFIYFKDGRIYNAYRFII